MLDDKLFKNLKTIYNLEEPISDTASFSTLCSKTAKEMGIKFCIIIGGDEFLLDVEDIF